MNLQKELGMRDEQLDRAHRAVSMMEGITYCRLGCCECVAQRALLSRPLRLKRSLHHGMSKWTVRTEQLSCLKVCLCL